MSHSKTTWYGGLGVTLTTVAPFVPPPYNLIPLGLGTALTTLGFYFAADADAEAEKPYVDTGYSTVDMPWKKGEQSDKWDYKSPTGYHE